MGQDILVEDFLAHYGVRGMKWGVRKANRPAGVSARTNREAKKDATEFTKAKMFYGESAGTRRKLIKATVEGKSKKDPSYKKAFDFHMEGQDLSKRASQARGERKRRDTKNSVKRTGKGVIHVVRGNSQYASIAAVGLVGAFGAARARGIDRQVMNAGKQTFAAAKRNFENRGAPTVDQWLKQNGYG